jgi:hypothetical protein
MQFANKKLFLQKIVLVYVIFSLPAVFYAGYKTIRKMYYAVTDHASIADQANISDDFDLENESDGGGGAGRFIDSSCRGCFVRG